MSSLHRPQRQNKVDPPTAPSEVKNPSRYQSAIEKETIKSISETQSTPSVVRFGVVRESSANTEARTFLYNQYQGRCQVTDYTFLTAKSENYFVAVCLTSRTNAEHLNHPGNMLCLSADTAAKFMYGSFEWIDDLEFKIQQFKASKDGGRMEDRQLRILIAGEIATITWTEQHFMRMIALWNHA